ncbi:MAG: riboflavin synthase [Acidobacteria bacterium]|nr:riboflavin synthase [Acidobacteriota bacterium]MBV9625834.1 riboflavin synthase [Acidobacteriota bacterium]
MFTGIIEEVGQVAAIRKTDKQRRLTVSAVRLPSQLKRGSSIAVSGACLTATAVRKRSFDADLAQETWMRTSFSRLKPGALVNLELPLKASGRFDGHIVQGHVDGIGTLLSLMPIAGANDYWLTITVPSQLARYIVPKGSLAIEGISLTVAAIDGMQVRVAIIPHTAEATNLCSLKPGEPVNLEIDVIAKYVEKMVGETKTHGSISLESLVGEGF